MGWTYDDVLALPLDVYVVLVETLNEDTADLERARAKLHA